MSASVSSQAPPGNPGPASTTYRVYVRLPKQKVTAKTNTPDEAVARLAWDNILGRLDEFRAMGAIGVVMSRNNVQVEYLKL